jgi:hypothetical protein
MACMPILHVHSLFSRVILLANLPVWLTHRLILLTRLRDLLIQHPANRIMVIADGISMMYLQKMAFAY